MQLLVAKQAVVIVQRLFTKEQRVALIIVDHEFLVASIVYFGRYQPFGER